MHRCIVTLRQSKSQKPNVARKRCAGGQRTHDTDNYTMVLSSAAGHSASFSNVSKTKPVSDMPAKLLVELTTVVVSQAKNSSAKYLCGNIRREKKPNYTTGAASAKSLGDLAVQFCLGPVTLPSTAARISELA